MSDPLFAPFTIKNVVLRNRIVSTSHEPAYGEDGLPKDRYRAYHREKARGGVGLTMMGGSALVSPDSTPVFGNLQLYRDEAVPYRRLGRSLRFPDYRGNNMFQTLGNTRKQYITAMLCDRVPECSPGSRPVLPRPRVTVPKMSKGK